MLGSLEKRSKDNVVWSEAIWGYVLILPSMLLILVFTLLPVITSAGMSLTKWSIFGTPEFIGVENYERIFSDPVAKETFSNTFIFTFSSVPVTIFLSLLLASALNQKIRGLTIFRAAYYIPVISASVAVGLVFLWIFDTNFGLLNKALAIFGIDPIRWLVDPDTALLSIILVSIWRGLGFNMIIFLAALQDVPNFLYDAARIDGANRRQLFLRITLPLVTPAVFFTSVTGLISSFQSFDLVYSMTQGGPVRSTYLIGFYIWKEAFDYLHMGYGAALSVVLFVIILCISLLQWTTRRKWVYAEE